MVKILGLTNNDDCLWFRFEPSMAALNSLITIFNLDQRISNNGPVSKEIKSYNMWLKERPSFFLIDEKFCLAYIILSLDYIHLLLKKNRRYSSTEALIYDSFEFK